MSATDAYHAALIRALQGPDAWPHPVGTVDVIETHISSILLAGGFAYKIKKPVDLGFLDFSTLPRRKHCCEEELRLNCRLAPEIYLEVVPIGGTPQHPVVGGGGEPFEYAVKMHRFPGDGLLSHRPEGLPPELMDAIAEQVVQFHAGIAVCGAGQPFGDLASVLYPMQQNFEQIQQRLGTSETLERLQDWTLEQHAGLRERLTRRKADGFIRECHGDLHLGNITLVEGRALIFDGIEFNPDLRWIDTMSEIAFLVMDLDACGRPELARWFLNAYIIRSGDFAGLALLRFYQVYRAMVRAKVAAIRLGQSGLSGEERAAFLREHRAYLKLAEGYTTIDSPALLITHGSSGSGKSVAARLVVMEWTGIWVRSDVERKRLAGLPATARTGSEQDRGIYSVEATQRTYHRLLEVAEQILMAGLSVVVDATFLKHGQRQLFESLATRLGFPFVILDIQTPETLLRERVRSRLASGHDPSEADKAVLLAQLDAAESLTEEEHSRALAITPERLFSLDALKSLIQGG